MCGPPLFDCSPTVSKSKRKSLEATGDLDCVEPQHLSVLRSLGFTSNSRPFVMIMNQSFGQCKCVDQHAAINEVNWSETVYFESCHESIGSDMIVLF